MTLSASLAVDPQTGKPVLTVDSDDRSFTCTVTSPMTGETATAKGMWGLDVEDTSGRKWIPVTDTGIHAVYIAG